MDVVVLLLINVVAGLRIYLRSWARQALLGTVDANVLRPDHDINIDSKSLRRRISLIREK